jgi:hypothetical protein
MKYDKLGRQKMDPLNDPIEIDLLGHHVGVFTDYFVRDAAAREDAVMSQAKDYSIRFVLNQKNVYNIVLNNPNAKIRIVFLGPDSLCFPSVSAPCTECLRERDDIFGGSTKDELHRNFMKSALSIFEAQNILFYEGLSPGEFQNQPDFIKSVFETGENIMKIYNSSKRMPFGGYSPYGLGCQADYKEITQKHFPKVYLFRMTELYKLFIGSYLDKQVFSIEPSRTKIYKAIENYPKVLSGKPEEIYEAMLESIK